MPPDPAKQGETARDAPRRPETTRDDPRRRDGDWRLLAMSASDTFHTVDRYGLSHPTDLVMCILVSCEHGGTRVPTWVWPALGHSSGKPRTPVDSAARFASVGLSERLGDLRADGRCLVENEYATWLIDVARNVAHPRAFSPVTRRLPRTIRHRLIREVHEGYRRELRQRLSQVLVRYGIVVHLAVTTFPWRSGAGNDREPWRADVGLGYDPSSTTELAIGIDWVGELYDRSPMLRVRRNYPRRGQRDCVTRAMRDHFAGMRYYGIELQLNRSWAARPLGVRDRVLNLLGESLRSTLKPLRAPVALPSPPGGNVAVA